MMNVSCGEVAVAHPIPSVTGSITPPFPLATTVTTLLPPDGSEYTVVHRRWKREDAQACRLCVQCVAVPQGDDASICVHAYEGPPGDGSSLLFASPIDG